MRTINVIIIIFSIVFFQINTKNNFPVESKPDHVSHNICAKTKTTERTSGWRPVQEKIRDSVVQIFCSVAELDLFEQYKTPNQGGKRGSGFFISENGDILTNRHVIDQAVAIWIQIPSLGKRPLYVHVVGICPEKDLALLRLNENDFDYVIDTLGSISYLPLGNSDNIFRSDEVITVGYPLGLESLKSTNGIVSGFETVEDPRQRHILQGQRYILTDAPINPGSSGGPVLNVEGEVVGISTLMIKTAQNVGYFIPINTLKFILTDLYKTSLLRKPHLGILFHKATNAFTDYLGNPQPGGYYVNEVIKEGLSEKAGIQVGDMIYEINGQQIDIYGDMNVDWSEDKVSLVDYLERLNIGEEICIVGYRLGERIEKKLKFNLTALPAIRNLYPWREKVDFEVFAGMVIVPLTLNHIDCLREQVSSLQLYEAPNNNMDPVLFVSHVFSNSKLAIESPIKAGSTLNKINEMLIRTLDDFRMAIKKSIETGYVVIETIDQIYSLSKEKTVLYLDEVLEEIVSHSQLYHYPISKTVQFLLDKNIKKID